MSKEMPQDVLVALKECQSWEITRTLPEWYNHNLDCEGFCMVINAAIKEIETLREQYNIQNDSYSRLCKQVYGNG